MLEIMGDYSCRLLDLLIVSILNKHHKSMTILAVKPMTSYLCLGTFCRRFE